MKKERISTEKNWYAIKTRFKAEKRVTADLRRIGIEVYLPLIQRTKRYTRKVKRYEIPLINCYLFVRIDQQQYVKVLERPHVIEFLRFGGEIIPVPEAELDTLRRVCGEINAPVTAERISFVEGEEVELLYGQLSGLRGRLVKTLGRDEFVVQLQSIGYQLRIVVEGRMLLQITRT